MRHLPRLKGESDQDYIQRQLDPIHWARLEALRVFTKIAKVIGEDAARRVFEIWSEPPSAAKLRWIEDGKLRNAIELMGRTKGQLAKERAEQKHGNPTPEQIEDEKRQLRRRLNKPKHRPKPGRGRTKLS